MTRPKNAPLSLDALMGPPLAPALPGSGTLAYDLPIPELTDPGFPPFTRLLLAIWQLRSQDLQRRCPLTTRKGRLDFLAWCVVHGKGEYRALAEQASFWSSLDQPALLPETPWSGGISRLMQLALRDRRDLGMDPRLGSEKAQQSLLAWYWLGGGHRELGIALAETPPWQKKFLLTLADSGFSRFSLLIHASRPDLQAAFNLQTATDRQGYSQWLTNHARQELPRPPLARTTPAAAGQTPFSGAKPSPARFGVNLIGYAFGELGIGEDVRMAAHALHAAGVPFTVLNFPPGADIRQADRSIAQWVGEQPLYPLNIVCLTALEHLRLFSEQGAGLFRGRYTIGYWPWELAKWPGNWAHCFNLADEVWVSSRHTRQAAEAISPVPLLTMPMAVALPEVAPVRRADYGLPDDHFLFVFSFDGKSSLARKNPLAVLQAFALAFPAGDEPVGLVIKCMRPEGKDPAWRQTLRAAKADPRIRIIARMLSKPEVLGLYRACDCFVSLHRAEGFGRGIAEALLLGLAVIATDHGGNVDFCRAAGAGLVPWQPVAVGEKEYVEPSGQFWAEPDPAAAARMMGEVAGKARKKSRGGDKKLQSLFGLEKIGAAYRKRLEHIFEMCQSNRLTNK